MFKRLLISFLTALVIFVSIAPNFLVAKAQATPAPVGTWYNSSFGDWFNKVYDDKNPSEIFGERYTAAQVQWVMYGLFAFILNSSVNKDALSCFLTNATDLQKCIDIINPKTKATSSVNNQNLLQLVFADRPLSGISYTREKIQNFSLIPVAHAQTAGFGFDALSLVQGMWKSFRDISFGLFVIVAVVFAFMIMFRVKLSPQTVISVQSALPKIVIALILVTFSYAIAGFLIDFMYIIIGLISLVMAPLIPTSTLLQTTTYTASDLFRLLTLGLAKDFHGLGGIFGLLILYLQPMLLLLLAIILIGVVFSETGVGAAVAIIFLILLVIVVIVILWMSIKTIWALLKAFANILLLTIFAPLQLVLGTVIPSLDFGSWVKNYISNLSVFVVTGVMFLFAWIFSIQAWIVVGSMGTNINLTLSGEGGPWPPLLGTSGPVGTALLFLGVSFVMFTLIPKATEVVQGLLSGKPFAYGTAIGEAFGPITGPAGWVGNTAMGTAQREFALPAMQYAANQAIKSGKLSEENWMYQILNAVRNQSSQQAEKVGGPAPTRGFGQKR